jgi:hypothetical protein
MAAMVAVDRAPMSRLLGKVEQLILVAAVGVVVVWAEPMGLVAPAAQAS